MIMLKRVFKTRFCYDKAMNKFKVRNRVAIFGTISLMIAVLIPVIIPLYAQAFCSAERLLCGLGEPELYGTIFFVLFLVAGIGMIIVSNKMKVKKILLNKKTIRK